MNDATTSRPPAWFWVLAIAGLAWEAFGVATYLMHVGILPMDTSGMSEAQLAVTENAPAWATGAYALAVFAGLLGAAGLVLRKAWARLLLILSLLACIVQFGWWVFASGAMEAIGPSMLTMPIVIIVIGLVMVWLAQTGVKRGWLT